MKEQAETNFFSKALKATPIILDSSDLGLINRPRLFWTKIDWNQARTNPFSGAHFSWSKVNKIHRLSLDMGFDEVSSIDLRDRELHQDIVDHKQRIPSLTTPAPTEAGRPAPKRMRGQLDPLVKQRWLSDNRKYAPWAYEPHALERDSSGGWHTLSITTKEQLHGFQPDYTMAPGITEDDRHRMMANSWHLKVIIFLLTILLRQICAESVQVTELPPSRPPRRSTLQYMINLSQTCPALLGPGLDLGNLHRARLHQPRMLSTIGQWPHWPHTQPMLSPSLNLDYNKP